MKSPRNFKKSPISFLGLILFLFAIGISTFLSLREFKKQRTKPTEVIIANITSTQGEIYWKTKREEAYTVIYKQNSYDAVETNLDSTLITKDPRTEEYIYSASTTNLNPNSEYLFSIKTEQSSWNQTYSFKTKDERESLSLPELLKGDSGPEQLILIKTDTGNYIRNTKEHGTWLIEKPKGNYSIQTYSTYSLKDNTRTRATSKFSLNPSPALAQTNEPSIDLNNITVLELERGTSFIQIPIFSKNQSEQISTARELIQFSDSNILSIGLFRNDSWEEIVINEDGRIYGEDFDLIPGEVYMFITKGEVELPIIKDDYSSQLDIERLRGWNLIPTSIFNYFPLTSRDILLDEEYRFISQVATWNSGQSSFDYTIEHNPSEIYGETVPLSTEQGLFVKIPY
jgi:hypothetical protein